MYTYPRGTARIYTHSQPANDQPAASSRHQIAHIAKVSPVSTNTEFAGSYHSSAEMRQRPISTHLRVYVPERWLTLEKIDYKGKSISNLKASKIMEKLFEQSLPDHIEIDLSNNMLTSCFAKDLADLLTNNIHKILFITINLSNNFITDEGASFLTNAIAKLPPSFASIDINLETGALFISETSQQALKKTLDDSTKKQSALADCVFPY